MNRANKMYDGDEKKKPKKYIVQIGICILLQLFIVVELTHY